MTTPITAERIHEVRVANDDLLWRYPNAVAVGEGYFKTSSGDWMDIIGIIVHVSERVSPTTVPVADRITDIIDGVPFQIRVDEPDDSGDAIVIPNDEHRPLMSGMRIENAMTGAIRKRLSMTTGG